MAKQPTIPPSLPTTIRMDPDLLARIDRLAAAERRTRNNLICVLLEEALATRENPR